MKKSLVCVAVAVLMSACGPSPTPPDDRASSTPPPHSQQFAHWPETLEKIRFHWSAEPGVDLTTGPGVLARAYLESYDIATFTFDLNNVYPGFLRATPRNVDSNTPGALIQLTTIRPLGDGYTMTPKDARSHFGYLPYHVLELSPLRDGYQATVCTAEYASYVESNVRPGKYISLGTDDKTGRPLQLGPTSGVFVNRIEFTQHDPRVGPMPPQPPTAPQTGPAPAPADDVFGNWFVTASSVKLWGPVGNPDTPLFPTPDLEQRCADTMPQNEAERIAMMTGYKDAPPPSGNAVPGWPLEPK